MVQQTSNANEPYNTRGDKSEGPALNRNSPPCPLSLCGVVATRIFDPFPANRQRALNEDQGFFHLGSEPPIVRRLIDEMLLLLE